MRVVVSDAYSTSNVGDGELVRLTVGSVAKRFSVSPVVLATDPDSFGELKGQPVEYIFKPLSRQEWRTRGPIGRIAWLGRETIAIASILIVPKLPIGSRRRFVRGVQRLVVRPWLTAIAEADLLVGVGGGYIGDKYLRESLITLWCFRFATAIGVSVETMPLSVSSAESRVLQRALKNTRGVRWRSREERTHRTLRSLDLTSDLVPDLAWLNAGELIPTTEAREGVAVAPVGSSFYSDSGSTPHSWTLLEPIVAGLPTGSSVRLIPMHRWDPKLGDGEDDRACASLASLVSNVRPDLVVKIVTARTYEDVRRAMRESEYAICERLHAALAATTTATPVVILGYEPKHRGVMGLAGLEDLCNEDLTAIHSYSTDQLTLAGSSQRQCVEEAVMI
ncbi:polysaccharide pyruvyl transferase family protein [Microbacterium sp. P5_E9]